MPSAPLRRCSDTMLLFTGPQKPEGFSISSFGESPHS